jgi:hypothetical protein
VLLLRRAAAAGAGGEPAEGVWRGGHVGGAGGRAAAVSRQWLLGPQECVGGESLSGTAPLVTCRISTLMCTIFYIFVISLKITSNNELRAIEPL